MKKKLNKRARHPVQPLITDSHGVTRFKKNEIVEILLDNGPFNMNTLAMMNFSREDREQFAQLIGYSLSGFGDLSYVSDEIYEKAAKQHVHGKQKEMPKKQATSMFKGDDFVSSYEVD